MPCALVYAEQQHRGYDAIPLVVTVAPGCTVPYQLSMISVVIGAAVVSGAAVQ